VFSPWIEDINLTKLLVRSCESNCEVIVITRQPNYDAKRDWEIKQAKEQEKCHENLRNAGIDLRLRNDIHGKVMIVDKQIAIVSSFNFTRNPARARFLNL
jgi:phosphatidylserine/phosphatidylglycerophosphate/cardiolipin synthase-like enzyme